MIVSIDKDLLTLEGMLYNYRKDEIHSTTSNSARLNFWVQMLIGDVADNVPGLKNPAKAHHKNPPNFSEATAKELLASDPENMRKTVEEVYMKQFGNEWEKVFKEHADLLFIQRKDAKNFNDCELFKR
jgi:5'-3' exonuclease